MTTPRFRIRLAALLAATSALTACASLHTPSRHAATVWETDADQSKLLARQPDIEVVRAPSAPVVVTVDAAKTYQSMVGFGAAMTDASAYVINHDMSPGQRDALMNDLFASSGLGLSFMRLTIGASDFSRTHYTYDDVAPGAADPELAAFSIAPARTDVIPLARQALSLNTRLTIMASPWSAPAWMKSTGSLYKGQLRPEAYDAFARYLVRYVTAMKTEGVPVSLLTLQNEPGFEPADYPGMAVPPATRAAFIGRHLGPTFAAAGLNTKILDYDHNWDLPASPRTVLGDPTAARYIAGVAWHCYAGDVPAQSAVHDAFPAKDAYFTECSGGRWAADFAPTFAWNMKTLIIGAPRNWARGVLLWNLALDEHDGPHLGGCNDCRGVVTVDSKTGAVTRNLEYYALGHASRFVKAGAVRIFSDSPAGIETVAFRNPDGGRVLIAFNSNPAATAFAVSAAGRGFTYTLPAGAAATFTWK